MLPQKAQPGEYKPGQKLYSQPPPPSIYFFPPGSARFPRFPPGFRQVPPGSAGFRWVLPGSAGFGWVPPLRRVPLGSAGFQAFAIGQFRRVVPGFAGSPPTRFLLPAPPFNLLLRLCQVLARRLPMLRQSKRRFL